MDGEHVKNIFEAGGGSGMGGGLGAGLVGGVLGGALFGNNGNGGLFGNNGNNGGGAAIPLQIASAQSELSNKITDANTANLQGHFALATRVGDATATLLASQNMINTNVMTQGSDTRATVTNFGVSNLAATKDAQYATAMAVSASTKEILAALNDQNTANLQRQLTVAEQALLETRAESRARGTEVNVTQTVNQAQAQTQAQQQAQQQMLTLQHLCTVVQGLQSAVATNSNMIIGNTGAVGTGPQTANPVNVRT
jgi:hypothetical protein